MTRSGSETPASGKSVSARLGVLALPLSWAYGLVSRLWFSGSEAYWEKRYASGGNSGAGSYGRLARFKAGFLNQYVRENSISSVAELGCGDGSQLLLAEYPSYVGFDVSETIVAACRERFKDEPRFSFEVIDGHDPPTATAELALSLDVIYHLVEDDIYERHMSALFEIGRRAVIIYSSNSDASDPSAHVRHRRFTDWVANRTDWALVRKVENPYPYDRRDPFETSWADFHVFEPEV